MVVIVMPWRPSPERQAGHDLTRAWYEAQLPGVPIVEVDTDHEEFNLGACRNKGVIEAKALGATTCVITDADTITWPHSLHTAIDASPDGKLHYPFDKCLYAGVNTEPGLANGGIMVISVAGWEALGGQDERLSGWGGDDDQIVAVATCFGAGPVRHKGYATSFWHPANRDIGSARHAPNAELVRRYWSVVNNPTAMKAILSER